MKLTKSQQLIIDWLVRYKTGTFDSIQEGKRFMHGLHSLIQLGAVIQISTEQSMYDQRRGLGKVTWCQQVYVTAYTVRLSDNYLELIK